MSKVSFKIEHQDGVVDEISTTAQDMTTKEFIEFLGRCYVTATYCNDLEVTIKSGFSGDETVYIKGMSE